MCLDLKVLKNMPPWEWPPETRDFIFAIILDNKSSSSYLLDALELGGNPTLIDDKMANAFLNIIGNESLSNEVRVQAAISLGPALEWADADDFEESEGLLDKDSFFNIKNSLKQLFHSSDIPENVRRKILEASIRAPEKWHKGVLKSAFKNDRDWQLTAVFGMRWVRGCDEEILTALQSPDSEILFEAVCAAGSNQIDSAWKQIIELASNKKTEKYLLMASIEAAFDIRPDEAGPILVDLSDHGDHDIGLLVNECMVLADGSEDEYDEYDEYGEFDDQEPLH